MRGKYVSVICALLVVVCAACGDDNDDSMTSAASGPTSGSTTGDATGDATTSTTTDTGSTSGDNPTGGTTGGDTTGEPDGTPCEEAAAYEVMCNPDSPAEDELVESCELQRDWVEMQGASCAALYDAAIGCIAALTCAADPAVCDAMFDAAFMCVEVGEVCQAFGAKEAECSPDDAGTAEECQLTLNQLKVESGEACATAYEQFFACYGQQTCADLESGGCEAEATAYVEACEE